MAISKNQIKYIKSLQQKKFRQMYGNFVAEGDKLVKEIASNPEIEIEGIYALPEWQEENAHFLNNLELPVFDLSKKELERISGLKTPNQTLIIAKQKKNEIRWDSVSRGLSLYLDDIQNPGNIGTILRIADWFGINHVFCSPNSGELYNPKVIQASMGAFLRINYFEITFEKIQQKLENILVYATVMDGENIFEMDLKNNGLIVIGNEGRGISQEILKTVNHRISIPSHNNNGSESLNVSVATGIVCAAFRNQ